MIHAEDILKYGGIFLLLFAVPFTIGCVIGLDVACASVNAKWDGDKCVRSYKIVTEEVTWEKKK